jgi:hypothetical protein
MYYCRVVYKGVIDLEEENRQIKNIENKSIQGCEGSETSEGVKGNTHSHLSKLIMVKIVVEPVKGQNQNLTDYYLHILLVDVFVPLNQDKQQYPISLLESSQPSHPSPKESDAATAAAPVLAKSIHRINPHSDIFACENCRHRGD